MSARRATIAQNLAERFASTWRLLSETTIFLSRTSLFGHYERELMEMRRRLSAAVKSSEAETAVRKELVELRRALREQGYDLSLGKLDLEFQGFRNDGSIIEGFRRLVVFIGPKGLWYVAGEDNHLTLHDRLDRATGARGYAVAQKHYLWYRWSNGLLVLSGSDTEAKDDFEQLKAWASQPERRLFLLSRLKELA